MPEKVLPLPLSGEEVVVAICDQLGVRLRKDGYLNRNLAYDSFECKVTINLKCHDVGRIAETNVTETVKAGEVPQGEDPDKYLDAADGSFEINEAPPNEVRVETGQEVPVAGSDGKEKRIRYARGKAKKAS